MSDPTEQTPAVPSTSAPSPVLSEARTARTMRLSVSEGALTQLFLNWTTGAVLTGYLLHLDASAATLALVAAVPLLGQVTGPFAALLAARRGARKRLTVLFGLIGHGLWLLAALMPQLGVPLAWQPAALVTLVLVSSAFQSPKGVLWSSWMTDVVPLSRRGRYFGLRNGVLGVVGMLGNLAAGVLLDHIASPVDFQLVLGVGVVCSLTGVVLLALQDEPPMERVTTSLRATLTEPWRDANFKRVLTFGSYWAMVVMLAGPFVFPYFLRELGLSFTMVGLWTALASTCALLTSWWWGRVADHAGNKPVLRFCTVLAGVGLPGTWILAGVTGRLEFIWLSAVLDAVAWGGIGAAMFNLALGSAPRAQRTAFYATFSLATGVAGFLGGALSGPLLELLRARDAAPGGWSAYHSLFAISGVLRALAWLLLARVREPGEAPLRIGARLASRRGARAANATD